MSQLGRFDNTFLTPLGLPASGASVAVYREGATVNGSQSGTTPLTITVRHRGKIAAADTVFIGTTTGTTYSVDSVTATTVVVSGFVGTLAVSGGDRITPSNSQPTLYSDDQGGATTSNPLTTSATGRANCWMEYGNYDLVVSGGGSTTTAFTAQITPTDMPGQIRFASSFPGSDIGAQINNADADLGTGYGEIWADIDGKTMTTAVVVSEGHTLRLLGGNMDFNVTGGGKGFTIENHAKIKGAGVRAVYISVLSTSNVSAVFTNDDYTGGQQDAVLEGVFIDCWSNPTISQAPVYFKRVGEPGYVRDVYVLPGNGQVGMKFEDASGMLRQDIVINGRNTTSPILGGILVNDSFNSFGHLFINVHCDNIGSNGYGIKITGTGGQQRNVNIINFRNEQNGGSLVDGIILDDTCDGALIVNPGQTYNSGSAGNLVHMLAGSSNNVVVNAYGFSGGSINAVKDDVNSRTVTANCPLYIQGVTGTNIAASINGPVDVRRLKGVFGTALIASDFAIVTTGKWGDTAAATVTFNSPTPTDMRGIVNINSGGANFGANPTVVMTFKDGSFTNVPVVTVTTGAGTTDQVTVPWTVAATATTATFTWNGTPIASRVYQFCYHVIG